MDEYKYVVRRPEWPDPSEPYSRGVVARVDQLVFVSCQVPADYSEGKTTEGDVQAQTRQVFENMKSVLDAAGSSLADVLKVTLYLMDMEELELVNAVRREYFPTDPPAAAVVQVSRLVHPNYRIAVDAIAAKH